MRIKKIMAVLALGTVIMSSQICTTSAVNDLVIYPTGPWSYGLCDMKFKTYATCPKCRNNYAYMYQCIHHDKVFGIGTHRQVVCGKCGYFKEYCRY